MDEMFLDLVRGQIRLLLQREPYAFVYHHDTGQACISTP
jgi:hypothetical protein